MYALTVKQPWAQAIAQFGKNVENRKARPPAALIGQRIAIHVSKTWGINEYGIQLPAEMLDWTCKELARKDPQKINAPPHAGRIIATARLACVVSKSVVGCDIHGPDFMAGMIASRSPWFTGPVGWVLADVRPLAVPVGQECVACANQRRQPGQFLHPSNCNGSGILPISGKLYPFAMSPEVEAAILRQEAPHV